MEWDEICSECIITHLSHCQAMCFDCDALTCGHTCGYDETPDPQPVTTDRPPCEDWSCKHRVKCERAFEAGRLAALEK
jgi:hypothetical protein